MFSFLVSFSLKSLLSRCSVFFLVFFFVSCLLIWPSTPSLPVSHPPCVHVQIASMFSRLVLHLSPLIFPSFRILSHLYTYVPSLLNILFARPEFYFLFFCLTSSFHNRMEVLVWLLCYTRTNSFSSISFFSL